MFTLVIKISAPVVQGAVESSSRSNAFETVIKG